MSTTALSQVLDIIQAAAMAVGALLMLGLTIAALRYVTAPSQDRQQAHAAHIMHIMGIGLAICTIGGLMSWLVRLFAEPSSFLPLILQRLGLM